MAEIPFHPGEREAQRRAGFSLDRAPIRDFMSEQHRVFFAELPYALFAGAAADGSPVATVLTDAPGFLTNPDPRSLRVGVLPHPLDPFARTIAPGAAVGMLGIDLATRRRNRANGRVAAVGGTGFTIAVEQSFGNCPKYIRARDLEPAAKAAAPAADIFEWLGALDEEARRLVRTADTFFVASSSGTDVLPHGGLDISHRGGPAGFVRIDGDRLTVPDFSGNRYFNTLGNLLRDPRAALLFIEFASGDLLYLSGLVTIDWQPPAEGDGAQRSWRLEVQGGWRRRGGMPLRWACRGQAPARIV